MTASPDAGVDAPRRTQQQRREDTRAKLIDATVRTLSEQGYAATTAKNVVAAAGVSVGGMYRHFPTMLDLIVAAADEVRRLQFAEARAALAGVDDITVERCVELLREACRRPMNGAWYDLIVASRTDAALRERMAPFTERYHAEILDLARTLPIAEQWDPDAYAVVIFSVIHLLDGEAMAAVLNPQPELDAARTVMLATLLRNGTSG